MVQPQQDNLARDIAHSDPCDPQEQAALLGRIRELRRSIPSNANSDQAANLEMASLLTQYLVRMGGIGPEDVLQIISRLVGEVELGFTLTRPKHVVLQAPEPALPEEGLRLVGQESGSRSRFLGELMVQMGHVHADQVQEALRVQKASGVRVGEALVSMGAATWDQVKKAVEVQKQFELALQRNDPADPRGSAEQRD